MEGLSQREEINRTKSPLTVLALDIFEHGHSEQAGAPFERTARTEPGCSGAPTDSDVYGTAKGRLPSHGMFLVSTIGDGLWIGIAHYEQAQHRSRRRIEAAHSGRV